MLLSEIPPNNVVNVAELVDSALATSLHAARSAIHRALGVSHEAWLSTDVCSWIFLY
jgi:hypothetical protein